MKKIGLLFILCATILSAQDKFTLSGTITDISNGESLFGASVFIEGTTNGVITNEYGFLGFKEIRKEIVFNKNQKVDFELTESSTALKEVVVIAEETEVVSIRKPEMSVSKLNINTVKQMPVVLGEVDVIKSLQLLPGVTKNGEGSSGFHVRGGAADQNLVLLDEAIIYNTSHMLGFFSVFNADAIKDIKLYKGGIPARFGGRTSSVLDVRQKDGNRKNFTFKGGIGLISSRLALEGPLFKDKGSFLVAGRSSYANLFLIANGADERIGFYDLNLKTNYKLNEKNKLYLSGYFGRDSFKFGNSFKSSYGNSSGNLRWNYIFNDKLFSNLSFIYSKYDYDLSFSLEDFEWLSSINNYNIKYDFKYYLSNALKLDFGVRQVKPTSEASAINPLTLDRKKALEAAVYINAEHKLTPKLTAQYGLRYSAFKRLGGVSITDYANNQPVVYNNTLGIYERGIGVGETAYKKGDAIATFNNLEPRASLAYQLNEESSIKAGYSRAAQYIHLLSNTASVTPLDVWTPSGKFIKPQLSNQYALGYFRNFRDKMYSLETEVYYKTTDNRIDYIDGSDLIGNNTIETEILNGESRAYGLEFLVRKNKGDFTGWISYTLSKSEQKTPGGNAGGLGISDGKWYNTAYDRTHDFSVTGAYKLNKKWSFSSNFVFQTGRPVTYPNSQYEYLGASIANFSDRNSDRLPIYHRLDISATYKPNRKPTKRWKGEWVFGIYNVYNQKNAASISFTQNITTGTNEAIRTAIFGMVPSATYNFKF